MSKKQSQVVVKTAADLVSATDALRAVLLRYQRATDTLTSRVIRGDNMVEAIESVNGASPRPEVTEAIDAFEAARHRVRVAMVALALEQGASASEVGRALGVSRQLAARLAAEIEDA